MNIGIPKLLQKEPILVISLIFVLDIIILLYIPFIREMAGFIFLLFFPGSIMW